MKPLGIVLVSSVVFTVFLFGSIALATMDGSTEFILDFSKVEEAKAKAVWTTPEAFSYGQEGMSFSGDANTSRDLRIETTQLVPVGWSWRPVVAVIVIAKIEPAGEFTFGKGSVIYPAGQFYARYSPDGKRWSTWQNLEMQRPKDRDHPEQMYRGVLRTPYKERTAYEKLLTEYSKMDVPWGSDEEAAVKWILQKNPKFFQENLPFIGYVQFLLETGLHGGQHLKRVVVEVQYGASGLHQLPKDNSVDRNHQGPWRFKAE